jgi:hypothetical protein
VDLVTDPARPTRDVVNKIFGESIPNITSDERDDTRPDEDPDRDRWLRDNVPPHHG